MYRLQIAVSTEHLSFRIGSDYVFVGKATVLSHRTRCAKMRIELLPGRQRRLRPRNCTAMARVPARPSVRAARSAALAVMKIPNTVEPLPDMAAIAAPSFVNCVRR